MLEHFYYLLYIPSKIWFQGLNWGNCGTNYSHLDWCIAWSICSNFGSYFQICKHAISCYCINVDSVQKYDSGSSVQINTDTHKCDYLQYPYLNITKNTHMSFRKIILFCWSTKMCLGYCKLFLFYAMQQAVINYYFMISEAFFNHATPSADEKEVQQYSTEGYHLKKTPRNRPRERALKKMRKTNLSSHSLGNKNSHKSKRKTRHLIWLTSQLR